MRNWLEGRELIVNDGLQTTVTRRDCHIVEIVVYFGVDFT